MSVPVEQIAAELGFTLEELSLNQAGKLSSHQMWQSVKVAIGTSLFALVTLGLLAAIFFVVKPTGFMRIMLTVMGLLAAAVCLMVAGWRVAGAVSHKVLVAEGPLAFTAGYRRSTTVIVGSFRSTVDNAHKVLTPGERYRVYYLAHSGDLLSIEPLPASPSQPAAPGGSGSGSGG